jgi:hypothetical protein
MRDLSMRGVRAIRVGLLLLCAVTLPPLQTASGQGQPTLEAIGLPRVGENALEFLGRSDQDGLAVSHYGYITHADGVADAALFLDPASRTEASARFNYVAQTTLDTRHTLGNLIITAGTGTLTVYLNETPGGDFANPKSFARGTPVATYSMRYHSVLNVQQPNSGITTISADTVQLTATAFRLQGRRQSLGARGLRQHISATGQGTRTQEEPLRAFFLIGGAFSVTRR